MYLYYMLYAYAYAHAALPLFLSFRVLSLASAPSRIAAPIECMQIMFGLFQVAHISYVHMCACIACF